MNYTEEQYSELYNNLPKGLRDLVLTGALSAQVGALALKYGLTPEEQSELEPAIEDVALGLITPEELAENILTQVALDDERSQAIAGEVMRDIYAEHLEELRLTRKYKIELDERIRKEENGGGNQSDNEVDGVQDAPSVAGNIINITRQREPLRPVPIQDEKDKKVADWFSGKKGSGGRAALDALGDGFVAPSIAPTQKENPLIQQQSPRVSTPEQSIPTPTKPKSLWEQVTTEKPNTLNPTTTLSPSLSKSASLEDSQNRGFDKSLVQVEQQILTLTQAVNKMIEQNTKTINPVVQSVFNGGQYEEVNRRMDVISHRIDDLQSKLLSVIERSTIHTIDSVVEEKSTEASPPQEIKIVQETSKAASIPSLKDSSSKPQSFSSSVTKNALDGIFQTKKESPGNPVAIKKLQPSAQPTTPTTQPKIALDSAFVSTSRAHVREQLLKDLDMLKRGLQPSDTSIVQTPQLPEQPAASRDVDLLKEEIVPTTETDKMKMLQDKIKSLNKSITQDGIVSAGSAATDPYRQ